MANTRAKKSTLTWRLRHDTKEFLLDVIMIVPGSVATFALFIVVLNMWTGWFF